MASAQPRLAHLDRYLSTWSGTDKAFMIIQYSSTLLSVLLRRLLTLRIFLSPNKTRQSTLLSDLLSSLSAFDNLSSRIGDARILYRLFGLVPIIHWLRVLYPSRRGAAKRKGKAIENSKEEERAKPPPPTPVDGRVMDFREGQQEAPEKAAEAIVPGGPNRLLARIERWQAWSMVAYYPLEHLYYLSAHKLLPLPARFYPSPKRLDAIGVLSCRFWAIYVVLQLIALGEQWRLTTVDEARIRRDLLEARASSSSSSGGGNATTPGKSQLHLEVPGQSGAVVAAGGGELARMEEAERKAGLERADLEDKRKGIQNDAMINLAYLPLTAHWSFAQGIFPAPENAKDLPKALTGLFGTIAAIGQLRAGWKGSA